MIDSSLFKKYYPDDSKSGTLIFYDWLRAYVSPEFTVLNVGAGPETDNKIRSLKGEVEKVVGIDIDNDVLSNKDLDEAFVVNDDTFPFEDNYFDLIWSDYVLEHVEKPESP